MEEFSKYMQDNWEWISSATLLVGGGIAWLVNQRKDKQPPISTEPADVTNLAMTALSEKYSTQINDQQQTIDSLRLAVNALAAEKSDPDAPEGIDEALACLEQGDTNKAETIFQKIVEAKEAEGQGSLKEAAQAAMHIGALAFLHDTEKALAAYKKATQLDADDAEAWNLLGHLLKRSGDLAGAERAYNKVLALGNATADKTIISAANGNLGLIARTRGDLDRAEDYHQQSLILATELGHKEYMANQLGNLGLIAQTRGDLDRAEDYHQQSLTHATELGHKENMASQLGNLGLIARIRGNLDRAEDYHQQSLAIETELGHKEGMARELGNLGLVAQDRGVLDRAEDYHQQSLALHTELGHKENMASNLGNLGLVAKNRGDLDRAEDYLKQSLAIDTELGRKEYMANQLANLGAVAKLRGDKPRACRLWREALDLYQTVGIPHTVELVQGWLDEMGGDESDA